MADRALLAGYPRYAVNWKTFGKRPISPLGVIKPVLLIKIILQSFDERYCCGMKAGLLQLQDHQDCLNSLCDWAPNNDDPGNTSLMMSTRTFRERSLGLIMITLIQGIWKFYYPQWISLPPSYVLFMALLGYNINSTLRLKWFYPLKYSSFFQVLLY